MPGSVSKLVLEVDSSGVVKASGNLDVFSKAAKDAERAAAGLETASEKLGASWKDVYEEGSGLDHILGNLNLGSLAAAAGVTALVGAVGAVGGALLSFGKESVQTFSQFEQIQNSLSGVMRSAEKGKELFEDLRSFSFETTFGVDTLANAATQLISVGTATSDLHSRLKQLGDIAGGDTNKFNELVSIFTKIQNTGKASSIQLQQLALRGVPIYQTLQEIGVQGTATADDIVKAFDEMTGASGIFYNNMQSINDTIQGREGFVSDTWREFLASFAEASNSAEAYKAGLDIVYNTLQGFVDLLQKINANPVYKALFQGALITVLTTLAVTIGTTLVSALAQVIVKLGIIAALKTAINPASMLIGLGIGALTAGVVALTGAVDEANTSVAELDNAAKDFFDDVGNIEIAAEKVQSILNAPQMYTEEALNTYKLQIHELSEQINAIYDNASFDRVNAGGSVTVDWKTNGLIELTGMTNEQISMLETLKASYDEYVHKFEIAETSLANQNLRLYEQNELIRQSFSLLESVEGAYSRSTQGQLESLREERKSLQNLLNNGKSVAGPYSGTAMYKALSEQEAKDVAARLNEIDGQISSLSKKGEGVKAVIYGWRDAFESVTGVSAKGLYTLNAGTDEAISAGTQAVDKFIETLVHADEEASRLKEYLGEAFSIDDEIENAKQKITDLYEAYNGLLAENEKITDGSQFQENEQMMVHLREEIEKTSEEYKKLKSQKLFDDEVNALTEKERLFSLIGVEYDKELYKLKGLTDEEAEYLALKKEELDIMEEKANGDYYSSHFSDMQQEAARKYQETGNFDAKSYAIGVGGNAALNLVQGSDVGNFVQGFQQGGILGGIINTVIGALTNVISSLDDFDKLLNPITEILGRLKPIFQVIADSGVKSLDVIFALLDNLSPVLTLIANAIEGLLHPIMEAFDIMIAISEALQPISDLLNMLLNAFQGIFHLLFVPMKLIAGLFKDLGEAIKKFLAPLMDVLDSFLGWIGDILGDNEETEDEKQKELERLKELNKQYESLSSAIDEQNQYYLKQKELVNAQAYDRGLSSMNVNDLIVTPNGTFNTHPEDTIFAMKHPEDLAHGGTVVSVNIINQRGGDTDVSVSQETGDDGIAELTVTISKKVANDFATGANGWDNAVGYRQQRLQGRRVSS